jgi:hypothetical protein
MIIELPPHGSDQHPDDEQRKLAVLSYKPKATFDGPPDCLGPFLDHRPKKRDVANSLGE